MRLLSPVGISGVVTYLPHFIRVFYHLMIDRRVSTLAKLVPFVGLLLLLTPPEPSAMHQSLSVDSSPQSADRALHSIPRDPRYAHG
jgi:hypothetical protein